ncbi:MAG: hypothetical protein ACJ74O_17010 [Frankiaceae bacterium]
MAADQARHDDQSAAEPAGAGHPSPLALLVDAIAGGTRFVRGLPATAVRLPVRGLAAAFAVSERVQHEAAQLQRHAEQLRDLIDALRGAGAGDDAEVDEVFARAADADRDAVVTDLAERAAERAERVADLVAAQDGQHGPSPATGRRGPAPEAVAAGAPGTASDAVERAEREAARDHVVPGSELSARQLPLPELDQLSIGALRSRLPRLDRDQLVQLLSYERAHADRLQVVTMLENRIAKVESGTGRAAARKGTARKAPAKGAAPRKAAASKATARKGTTRKSTAGSAPGMDEMVSAPDGEAAQRAAEELGSNSPHP